MTEAVPAWMVDFARCQQYIAAALEYDGGGHEIEDVLLKIAEGKCQFWPGENSAVVTEIVHLPKKTECHYWLAGGDMDELKAMRPAIEKWAREQGCTRITLVGRQGWARSFLKGEGYDARWTVMSKEL